MNTTQTNEVSIRNDIGVLAALSQDLESVDGVRSVDWIAQVRGVIGDKPLFFNGVDVAIYSTPRLFAAHSAIDNALMELRANDDRLPKVKEGDVQRDWAACGTSGLTPDWSHSRILATQQLPGQFIAAESGEQPVAR